MRFEVRILDGLSPELYMAVGRLVLSPACLRENNNYPYKSTHKFTWHLLYCEGKVVAFMPLERKDGNTYKVDNYYAPSGKERGNLLVKLVKSVVRGVGKDTVQLQATVQKRDAGIFKYLEFIPIRETRRYVMMELVREVKGSENTGMEEG